jgi:streptomycin 6-kinase
VGGYASLALPATQPDGSEVVLKICFPHRESEHEADALAKWNGIGAIRLLDRDVERGALLLERCRPGTPLADLDQDDALDIAVELLPRLWVPAPEPFGPLAEEAAVWAADVPEQWKRTGKPFDRRLLDAALAALKELVAAQGDQVLVNQDLHAGNILRAERVPWLVIDPKPLLGEREFGVVALVRGDELGGTERDVLHRLDRLSRELELDRERVRLWTLVHTLAWAFDYGRASVAKVEIARWLQRAA